MDVNKKIQVPQGNKKASSFIFKLQASTSDLCTHR